jgi:hypothetical protein
MSERRIRFPSSPHEVTVLEFFIEHLSDENDHPIGTIKKFNIAGE